MPEKYGKQSATASQRCSARTVRGRSRAASRGLTHERRLAEKLAAETVAYRESGRVTEPMDTLAVVHALRASHEVSEAESRRTLERAARERDRFEERASCWSEPTRRGPAGAA
jgi:hypothetical protein